MRFYTLVTTTAVLAIANASPLQKRYGNETSSGSLAPTETSGTGWEAIPSVPPSNATSATDSITSSNIFQITTTAVESITLTYTLGPEGSSSVITTVIENTSTITMTSTVYVTLTRSDGLVETTAIPDAGASSDPVTTSEVMTTEYGGEPTTALPEDETTPTTSGIDPTDTQTVDQPTNTQFGNEPSATLGPDTSEPDDEPTPPQSGDQPVVTAPSEDSTAARSGDEPVVTSGFTTTGNEFFAAPEPTVTITNYLTTTETITMEATPTGASDLDFSDVGAGALFGSGHHLPPWISSLLGGQNGACSITTVTATVIEQSTVTVTPTGTDNLPIAPTATPSYGFGNGTDPITGFPTASSGFLTLYKRSTATKL